ncbi:3-deoxy-7-phosphoheptulonate synthase [Chromobacterium phragmitis]|uniref:3-deoxy-7-phosphoheptulonate synthase n=1 Tax=Chromobacterium phragmitis TaxID=2202141 RepID=UPI000DECFEEC|nr:3-deoxy-7-phosphoheptulonate synthase [Chromobacterium phragmitis]AXE31818.1 3-deoxy-7-phosphoheptulonate synthase [Chromobacterium phragmitis]
MIVVMSARADETEIKAVIARIEDGGLEAHVSRGMERTVIGAVGEERGLEAGVFEAMNGVERALRVVGDFRIVSRETQPVDAPVRIGRTVFGASGVAWLGGCAQDWSENALRVAAQAVRAAGGGLLYAGGGRGHASPYHYRALGVAELERLQEIAAEVGLGVVAELRDVRLLDAHLEAQTEALLLPPQALSNAELLREVGRVNKAVILQRDNRLTLDEWLAAAEHVALGGNHQIVLCECGRHDDAAGLDVGELAALRRRTYLPVIVAPQQAVGATAALMLARAALMAGACGLMLDCLGWAKAEAASWRGVLSGTVG